MFKEPRGKGDEDKSERVRFQNSVQLIRISARCVKPRNTGLHLHNARNTMRNSGLARLGDGNEIARYSPVMTTSGGGGRRDGYRFHDNDAEERNERGA